MLINEVHGKETLVPTSPGQQPSQGWWLMPTVFVTQLALVSISFPITELFTQTPLFYIDSPVHWYLIESAKAFAASGHLVGYDPYFAAGNIGGVGFNTSSKLTAAVTMLLSPWLSDIAIYKLFVFVAAVVAPMCIPFAARWLRLSATASCAAAVFGVVIWWVSALRYFHTAGLVSFVLCSYLALPYAVLIVRYLSAQRSWRFFVTLVVIGAIGFFTHPLFPLLVGPLVLALVLAFSAEIRLSRLPATFIMLPALCLLLNLPWILDSFRYENFNGVAAYQRFVDINIVWQEALGRITATARGSRLNPVLLFAATWTAVPGILDRRSRRIAIGLVIAAVGMILFAALGAAVSALGTTQPNRFSASAYLYLCIPAGIGVEAIFASLLASGSRRLAGAVSAIMLTAAVLYFGREVGRELSSTDMPHHGEQPPEVHGIGRNSEWIMKWLSNDTTSDARVLFEVGTLRYHDYAHMAGYLALTSNREFIGGHYTYIHFANFWDGFAFGRPIDSFAPEEFRRYLELYNIGWALAFSNKSKQFLDTVPGVTRSESFGPLQAYVVDGPHTFFLDGSGRISARALGRVELSDLSGSSVTLKYHYFPELQAVPPTELEPVRELDDPVPFVHIVNPPPRLTLEIR